MSKIVVAAVVAALAVAQAGPPKKTKKQVSLLDKTLRVLGILATPAGLKGDDEADAKPGDIWVARLPGGEAARQLTHDGGYRSPIFGDGGKSIVALRGTELVEVALSDGAVKPLPAPPHLSKLVGRESGPRGRILGILPDDRVGLFVQGSAEMEFLAYDRKSAEDLTVIRNWKNWTRVYDGGLTLLVKQQLTIRNGWKDILVQQAPADPVEVTHCRGAYCWQPSLAEDRRQVVYIRTDKKTPEN